MSNSLIIGATGFNVILIRKALCTRKKNWDCANQTKTGGNCDDDTTSRPSYLYLLFIFCETLYFCNAVSHSITEKT